MKIARMRRLAIMYVIGGVIAVGLNACGGPSARSAEATHEAWVKAMQSGAYQEAVDLLAYPDPTIAGATVTQYLETQNHHEQPSTAFTGGNLSQVEIVGVRDRGAEQLGLSLWTYANAQICWTTGLVQTDRGWLVNTWNITTDEACQTPSAS